jgi:hypothetical protein
VSGAPWSGGRRALLGAATAALAAGAAVLRPARGQGGGFSMPAWLDAWEAVLRRHVDGQGRVDFDGIARAPGPLPEVVRGVAAADPWGRPGSFAAPAQRLSFLINAYNALAMHGIVERGIPRSLGLLGRLTFFTGTTFNVGGRSISLKSLEDDVIRPIGEERIHFALNCMVRGCPRLPREPFRSERLEAQLAAAAREFCGSAYHVRPDPGNRTVGFSQIFDFYTRDFLAKAPDLVSYVNRWRAEPLPADWAVRFFDYDWTVNRQPGPGTAERGGAAPAAAR